MGRTSKFTFPVPGRKQKKPIPSEPADISAPLTKAQKILGTGGLNVDSPVTSRDHARFWDTRSNSGISISVSESTASYTNETSLETLDEGEVIHGVSGHHPRWDDESAIIPRARNGAGTRGNAVGGNDTITDASSLHRQRSSSTINTYYDKSKVPLSISQQTASSAMAKGLPNKASALLDMDRSFDTTPKSRRKKPSRLDLSYLPPKSKSPRHLSPSEAGQRGLVLGPDMLARSPSVMSASPDMSPPAIQERPDRKPRKKLTLETLRDHRLEPIASSEESPTVNMRTASSVNDLHHLYEHYEQRSFDEAMGTSRTATNIGGSSPRCESSHASSPGPNRFLSPNPNTMPPLALATHDIPQSRTGGIETPTISVMTPSSLKSQPTDTASISSRHTRTSKASKRTDLSMTDIDLRQNSVLSLSSDSEDDYEDRPNTSTSLSAPRRRSGTAPSPTSPSLASFPQRPSPNVADYKPKSPTSGGPVSPTSRTQFTPVGNLAPNAQITPPKITARTSSLSVSSEATQKASTSRFSAASTATARSASAGTAHHLERTDRTSHEFRPIAFIPAQGFRHARKSVQQSPQRRLTRLSTASDQSIPPSPTSIDFYLQSQHNSVAFDSNSIRSGKSMRSSIASTAVGDDASGRFIAVTRQEEMLLAALRNKRARMRDEIIAEFEEEQDGETSSNALPRQRSSNESKRSSGRQVSRNSSMSTVRLASLPEQPCGDQQQRLQLQPRPSGSSTSVSRKTSRELLNKSPRAEEQALPYTHRTKQKTSTKYPSHGEASSDLDDFSDFDYLGGDMGLQGDNPLSEAGPAMSSSSSDSDPNSHSNHSRSDYLTDADLFPAVPTGTAANRNKPLESRFNRAPPPRKGVDGLRVRISEADFVENSSSGNSFAADAEQDIPRPDSPISPVMLDLPISAAELPKKKQVRLSAVGFRGVETGLWGDDG